MPSGHDPDGWTDDRFSTDRPHLYRGGRIAESLQAAAEACLDDNDRNLDAIKYPRVTPQ